MNEKRSVKDYENKMQIELLATEVSFTNYTHIPKAVSTGHCLKPKTGLDWVWSNIDIHIGKVGLRSLADNYSKCKFLYGFTTS